MESTQEKLISVITITYNSQDEIVQCVDAVINSGDPRLEMIVIDNVSTDGTIALLQEKYAHTKNVRLVFNDENIGFARGCNQGARLTNGKYILLLNPDTVASGHDILKLAEYLDHHPGVGIVGPKIIDEQGITQESYGMDLTPWNEIVGKLFYSRYLEIIPGVKKWKDGRLLKDAEMEVGWIGGACTLIRRELYERVNGIDEAYFLSHADMIDLGKSISKLGYKIVLYPDIQIVHAGSKSIVNNRDMVLERAYRGTLYFFKKYYGFWTTLLIKIIYIILSCIKASVALPIALFKKDPYYDIARAHFKNAIRIIIGKL
jgi:GT2 family glycosyltransferase